jgi:hypothetical protein
MCKTRLGMREDGLLIKVSENAQNHGNKDRSDHEFHEGSE